MSTPDTLKACPVCAEQIQAAAVKCRFCNSALAPTRATPAVIEQTGKRWKGLKLLSVAMFIMGFLVVSASSSAAKESGSAPGGGAALGSLMVLGSIGMYVYARFGAWWHHG